MASCDDFMDVHEEYIKGGEIIYAPRTDSTAFIAGKERILFRVWLFNSPNVKTVDLYWNARADSLIIPVTPSTGLDSIDIILPDMGEKSYTFDIRTTDIYGNKSLWDNNFGNSYGSEYVETLMERRFKGIRGLQDGANITFYTGIEGMVRTEVRYETNNGEQKVVSTSRTDNLVFCPDAKAGTEFEFRSLFIPEELAIDTFALDWKRGDKVFPEPFEEGLIFYMPFDNNYTEAISEINANIIENPSFGSGIISEAYLGAANSYITFNTSNFAESPKTNFSVAFWYKINLTPSKAGIITMGPVTDGADENHQNNRNYGIRIFRENNDGKVFTFNIGNGSYDSWLIADSKPLEDNNQWVHITLTLSNDKARIYYDGEEVVSGDVSVNWSGCDLISIGSGAPRFNEWGHLSDESLIDDLRLYNKTLSKVEIDNLIAKSPK